MPAADDSTTPENPASEDSASRPFNPDGGEDEGSTSQNGDDDHLHEDQKPLESGPSAADTVAEDDPHKAEKLTAAGRDMDPDEGSD